MLTVSPFGVYAQALNNDFAGRSGPLKWALSVPGSMWYNSTVRRLVLRTKGKDQEVQPVGVVKSPFILGIINILVKFIYKNCTVILGQSKSFVDKIKEKTNKRVLYFPNWTSVNINDKTENFAPEIKI